MDDLEFHLINIKSGEIEPEIYLTIERDESGNIVKQECPENPKNF